MLSTEERTALVGALSTWAESTPDLPALGFLHGEWSESRERLMTPREIVAQVRRETPTGRVILDALEFGVRRIGLNTVVAILTRRRPETQGR